MVSIVPVAFPSPLRGTEMIRAFGVSPNGMASGEDFLLSTSQIAALASIEAAPFIVTPITTVGNGTLTAASLVGGEVLRSGPVAAFSDATDTAAAIVAQPGVIVGSSFNILVKNTTAFPETITAGSGVTLPVTTIVPPFSVTNYVATVVSTTAVTLVHIDTVPIATGANTTVPAVTALATVGAGTILAANFASGGTARGGAQSSTAFSDTTDTAAAIIAASVNLVNKIGTSTLYRYVNNTNAPATIGGGSGVTVSGVTVVPPNSWAEYLITYTAAATLTMVGVSQGYFPHSGTYINNGASAVTVADANVTAFSNISFTLKTVGGTVSASAPNIKTITPGTGFTVAGLASDTSTYNYEIRG